MARRLPLIAAALVVLVLSGLAACSPSAPASSYAESLQVARTAKDNMLRTSAESPVPAGKRSEILPLEYYPPDEGYRVPAGLQEESRGQAVEMLTSTGQRRHMRVLGTLRFTLKGQPLQLTAFAEEGTSDDRMFVPFTDATTGTETYGAGRYLDLARSPTGIYAIDFNTAYNPYCAYNEDYDCPVPPSANRLTVLIRAGEKKPRGR